MAAAAPEVQVVESKPRRILFGFRRNSQVYLPGKGYIANHPDRLTPDVQREFAKLGYKFKNDYADPEGDTPPPELYVNPSDSSVKEADRVRAEAKRAADAERDAAAK